MSVIGLPSPVVGLSRFPRPSLRLNFRKGVLDSRITYSGGVNGGYWDSSGVWQVSGNDEARLDHDPITLDPLGLLIEEERENKGDNFNANPTDITGLTKSGDANATLTVVTDSVALSNAGLGVVCSSGKVFRLDNSAGSSDANVTTGVQVGNTNKHSFSIYARKISGADDAKVRLSGGEGSVTFTNTDFERVISNNVTPGASTRQLLIQAKAGVILYFILNQLEEGAFVTSQIVLAGSAVTRTADVATMTASIGSARTILVKGRTAPGTGTQVLWQLDDGTTDNVIKLERQTSNLHAIVRAAAGEVADLDLGAIANDTDFKVCFRVEANNFGASLDGGAMVIDTSGAMPTGIDTRRFGSDHTPANFWNSTLALVEKWNRGLSDLTCRNLAA